ncbi:hypothetical protein [Methylobacterium sp. J-067]|uniref:hypothetical protein n=1 Tax=Methylobacterium sp. J-067 TaxID=2836648 RepID=UPI001FB9AAF1|nr:hypothetical protein [Methylobacterium sp. J-067]MCJ2023932.1 hypothetical protein [Methylobacterium sp. J-067]
MTATTIRNPKVCRIMPMLGSSNDAEALSACRRVGAILEKDGQSYVDLAAAIRVEGDMRPGGPAWDDRAWRAATGTRPRPHHRKAYTFTPAQSAEHRRMALWVRNADAGRLSDRERQFIRDIAHQRRELSVPQADWLAAICDRLVMEARCA